MTKRLLDLVLATTLMVPGLVLCALIAPLIAIETRANPLFRQTRIGRNGMPFRIWKLRTMAAHTKDGASHEIGVSTVTRSGRWVRRWKIDELPQLWNVLRGEMSFVGPRPCLPSQTVLIQARRALGVLTLRPGITGVAQVRGLDMSDPERLAVVDSTYCDHWSLGRDLSLLWMTATGHGGGDAAARPS
jgi:lipopolysaccharide/colanic/teichoic acid biosynthesis glycosyltransferase